MSEILNEMRFDGQVALVTGAGGNPGLGRSYARLLAARGARVVVNDIGSTAGLPGVSDNALAEAVVAEIIAEGGEAVADTHSVAEPDSARAAVQTAIDNYGRLDILVNNAGSCVFAGAAEMTDADMDLSIDINLMGVVWMCRAALPHLTARKYGRIVNTTSGGAFGVPRLTSYAAPKAGVIGYTRALAVEVQSLGDIRCNIIGPAAGTRMSNASLESGSDALRTMLTLDPDLVAPTVAYLAHQSCTITGQMLSSGMGSVHRDYFAATPDISGITTPEALRDSIDQLMGTSDSTETHAMVGFTELGAKPYRPHRTDASTSEAR